MFKLRVRFKHPGKPEMEGRKSSLRLTPTTYVELKTRKKQRSVFTKHWTQYCFTCRRVCWRMFYRCIRSLRALARSLGVATATSAIIQNARNMTKIIWVFNYRKICRTVGVHALNVRVQCAMLNLWPSSDEINKIYSLKFDVTMSILIRFITKIERHKIWCYLTSTLMICQQKMSNSTVSMPLRTLVAPT